MPGDDAESALRAGAQFQIEGIGSLYTRLGENLVRIEDADEVAAHYLGVMDEIRERRLDGEISVKLTQLGFDLDVERTFAHASALATKAAENGRSLWVDMEGSAYTEATIAFYERLKASHPNVGLCLQAYLRRTAADVRRLLPLQPGIRLVKGAYAEPTEITYQARAEVNANFLALSVAMLEAVRAGGQVRIALGTHDVGLIGQVAEHAAAMGLRKTAFEIQMLYGVRSDQQSRLNREGFIVRDLIAYGEAWYPWYMRRLAERPANVLFALRQMIG